MPPWRGAYPEGADDDGWAWQTTVPRSATSRGADCRGGRQRGAQAEEPRLRRGAQLYRYADDVVALFLDEEDARRVLDVLPKRLGKCGLTPDPEKTRLVRFKPPGADENGEPAGTFDLLGFMHRWQRSRKGRWVVRQVTAPSRSRRGLQRLSQWLRKVRHPSLEVQRVGRIRRLRGHGAYYGIAGNSPALGRFLWAALTLWRSWLRRRSQRASMPWCRLRRMLQHHPVPYLKVVPSWHA